MHLYMRESEVDALATELQAATGAPTKTEAVRTALREALKRKRDAVPLEQQIMDIQKMARDKLGPPDPTFNFKRFREELWGETD